MDPKAWDDFVLATNGSFLQSWDWGEFRRKDGANVTRVGDAGKGFVAQWVHEPLRYGSQIACYHGPVPLTANHIQTAAAEVHGGNFLHIELPYGAPAVELPGWVRGEFRQAPATRVLDLTKSLDELRAELHSKTRYNIGLAERSGVTVTAHQEPAVIEDFLDLLPKTSERHGIAAHPAAYYRMMAEALMPSGMLTVFLAHVDNKPIAAHLVVRFGKTATYLHGASDYAERKRMAPHLLQWHQIRWAREQGCNVYDFWGVAPPGASSRHPFTGITRFKESFGGTTLVSPGAFDLPRSRLWYTLYRTAKRIRG